MVITFQIRVFVIKMLVIVNIKYMTRGYIDIMEYKIKFNEVEEFLNNLDKDSLSYKEDEEFLKSLKKESVQKEIVEEFKKVIKS